jgi:hypothetical protein
MTSAPRRAALLLLALLVLALPLAGVAGAQDDSSCYPVPPGGCEPAPEPPPPPPPPPPAPEPPPEVEEVTCEDIIAAIAAGDVALDQDGDGDIDADDLPASCTCEEIQAAVDAGTLPADALPEECAEVEVLADTGVEAGPLALLALAGLAGGLVLVATVRKTA